MIPIPPTTMELIQLAADVERLKGKYRGTVFTLPNKQALAEDCLCVLLDLEVKGTCFGFMPLVGDLVPVFVEDEGPSYGVFSIACSERLHAWIRSGSDE